VVPGLPDHDMNRYSYVTTGTIVRFGGEAMGPKLHGHDSESCCGTHRVAPEAAFELEAQVEAKFHVLLHFVLKT
jgi:hypothetical protein